MKRREPWKTRNESPPKKSRAGKKIGPLGPIPTSYEEAGLEDRLIIEMRERDGKQWLGITAAIEEITGTKSGNTIMKNRYAHMKANCAVFKMEHVYLSMFSCLWCHGS